MTGLFCLRRGITEHPMFKGNHARLYAWVWMVEHARHAPGRVEINGRFVDLDVGQLCYSVRYLSEAFGMSKSSTERFLTRLKTGTGDGPMIRVETGTGQQVITLCNYTKHQFGYDYTGTQEDEVPRHQPGQERDRSGTNIKKERKKEELNGQKTLGLEVDKKPKRITENSFPGYIGKEHGRARLEHRRAKKATINNLWLTQFIKKMDEVRKRGGDPKMAIEMIVERNWQGFEVDWFFNANPEKRSGSFGMVDQLKRQGRI